MLSLASGTDEGPIRQTGDGTKKRVKIILRHRYSAYKDGLKQLNLNSLDSYRREMAYRSGLKFSKYPTHCALLIDLKNRSTKG